jgi:hypothetical protein
MRVSILILFLLTQLLLYAQSNLAKMAVQESAEIAAQETHDQTYKQIHFGGFRNAVINRHYRPIKYNRYVYFLNTSDPVYIELLEKYFAKNGLDIISYKKLGSNLSETDMNKAFKNQGIDGVIRIEVKAEFVNALPNRSTPGSDFRPSGVIKMSTQIRFYDDNFPEEPYLVLYGYGLDGRKSKKPKLFSNDVNSLLINAFENELIVKN